MDSDKTFAWLVVLDFGDDPELVTQMTGLRPTESYVKGDPWHGTATRGATVWLVESPTPKTEPLERVLEDLLDVLETQAAGVIEASRRFYTQIGIAAYFEESTPELHLDKATVRRIAHLGCSIDIDTYYFGGDDSVPSPPDPH